MIVGTDLINVRTHRYVPGTRRIEVSTRENKGSPRGSEGTGRGNDVYSAGNVVSEGAHDVAVDRSADGVRGLSSENRCGVG
jgi:hypothetical protein